VACEIVAPAGGGVCEVEDMVKSGGGEGGEACLDDERGFGTGGEDQHDTQSVEH